MTNLFICNDSSLKVWRMLRAKNKYSWLTPTKACPGKRDKCTNAIYEQHMEFWENVNCFPEDFMVSQKSYAHKSENFNIHYTNWKYPYGSFMKFEDNVYVASPELLLCEMAKSLSLEKMILLIMELCGTYTFDNNDPHSMYTSVKPVTTIEKVLDYASKLYGKPQKKMSRTKIYKAAKIAANNSASPQESRLFILLCGPREIGGYGIKNMRLNCEICLSPRASQILGQKYIRPDISNVARKIAIEYDSDMFHDNAQQNRKDKLRLDALVQDGWKIYSFVPGQIKNFKSFDNMAKMILSANMQSERIRTRNFYNKQKELMKKLYS